MAAPRYFHITENPIAAYIPAPLTRSARRTALYTGKPLGLWYAEEDVWAAHMNTAFRTRGVSNALRMSLGTAPIRSRNRLTLRRVPGVGTYYIYALPLADATRTTDILAGANPRQILVLDSTNLQEFIDEYFYVDEETLREQLLQYVSEQLADVETGMYVNKLLTHFDHQDEELSALIEADDYDAIEDYIQDKYSGIQELEWLFTESADTYIGTNDLLFPRWDWVNARLWADIWSRDVAIKFGGVEFAADIIDRRDPRCPWLQYLEVASGCIFNAPAFFGGAAPQLLKAVSFRPSNRHANRNVYGQLDGVVYKAANIRRVRSRRQSTNRSHKLKNVTRRRRVSA
jgi:hypothetical protein